jgi:HEAT repeat protein
MRRILLIPIVLVFTASLASAQPNTTGGTNQSPPSASDRYVPPSEIDGENMDAWIKKLSHRDPETRRVAIGTVPNFGAPAAKESIPKIVDLLGDRDTSVRIEALYILSTNPIDDPKQLTEIITRIDEALLTHSQVSVRIQAALALARIGPVAAKTLPRLLSEYALRNPNSYELRKAAAFAIGRVALRPNGPDPKVLEKLLPSLTDESATVRADVIESLIVLGRPSDDKDWQHELRVVNDKLTTERNEIHLLWLRVLIMRLDAAKITSAYLKPIADALLHKDHRVRMAAVQLIWMMGKAASPQAGALRAGLLLDKSEKPDDLDFLAWCLAAIGQMGTDAAFMVNEVKPLAEHKNEEIKNYAKQTLQLLLPPAKK